MRIKRWNWKDANKMVNGEGRRRLLLAAELVAAEVRAKLRNQIGKGATTGISRPIYKKGVHRGQPWTQRNFGALLNSIRVVEKKERWGFEIHRERNVRVYAGHYLAYYARIFEYSKPFMRTGWRAALSMVKSVIKTGSQAGLTRRSSGVDARGYAKAKGRAF